MLGDLITRSLVLILGYAYPAFECFKTIEKNRVENQELRFWCQYWIIVALLTVFERIGDVFISWLPMYGEMKLALFIYLWYPKTKGTGFIYESLLRPFVVNHETDIERTMKELRVKAWDLAIYYWQNSTELGQTKFFEIIQYLASRPSNISNRSSEVPQNQNSRGAGPPPPPPPSSGLPPPPPSSPSSFFRRNRQQQPQPPPPGWPPSAPPMSNNHYNAVSQTPKSNLVQVQLPGQTQPIYADEMHISSPTSSETSESGRDHKQPFRLRIRRSK